METNNHKIADYDLVLDAKFGKPEITQRAEAEKNAYNFYAGKMLLDARKEAKMTQSELASRTNTTKSYISRIENGLINPSISTFLRIIEALGLKVEIVKPIM